MSRTQSSLKNMKYAVIGQFLALVVSFIARMVFVQTLDSEYLGINGLFTNILSMISFVELGVGSAIIYNLYKPLSEKNETQIIILMSFYKRAYRIIGFLIMIIGLVITPFLHLIIKDVPDIPQNIYLIFILFVANSAISYFYIYKRSLIIADQKRYIATFYRYGFFVLLNILQIIILLTTTSYMLFLFLQILFTLIENIVVSKKADKLYPFIKSQTAEKMDLHTKSTISKNIKAMMGHKFGGVIVNGTDNVIISKYVGIVAVGLYSNYLLIIGALNTIISLLFQAVIASVGNLGVTETREKSLSIFKCIDLIGFWIYGLVTINLFVLLNPLILLWIGQDYLFEQSIVLVLLISFFLNGMRKSVLTFRDAFGLFWHDRYKPIVEVFVNLVVSIILVNNMGISGVFLGTIISIITTCLWVEPYVLFKHGFKSPLKKYFIRYTMNLAVFIIAWLLTLAITNHLNHEQLVIAIILKAIASFSIPNIVFLIVYWRTTEFGYLRSLLMKVLKKSMVKT